LSIACSFDSHTAQKSAGRRELLDSAVVGIGDQNVCIGVDSDSSWRIKLSLIGSSATLKEGSRSFRQGAELRRRRVGNLVNYQTINPAILKDLRKISGNDLFVWSLNELSLPNSAIERDIADTILFQKTK